MTERTAESSIGFRESVAPESGSLAAAKSVSTKSVSMEKGPIPNVIAVGALGSDKDRHPASSNSRARLRLFCFPYAGGGSSVFRCFPEHLPRGVEVCPIQLPGRESRWGEPPFTRMPRLVDSLARTLPPYFDRPFAFFGHSLGAFVAFELARELRRTKAPAPLHLFVSGARAPHIPDPAPHIHKLPDAELLQQLLDYNGIPPAILEKDEYVQLFFPILRADFELYETYAPLPPDPLDCPISAFAGLQDRKAGAAAVAAWKAHTRAAFTFHVFPGEHFFLFSHQKSALEAVSRQLLGYEIL
jgi:medium-chain acyl-[acyl-carrier-protein] hydrolase